MQPWAGHHQVPLHSKTGANVSFDPGNHEAWRDSLAPPQTTNILLLLEDVTLTGKNIWTGTAEEKREKDPLLLQTCLIAVEYSRICSHVTYLNVLQSARESVRTRPLASSYLRVFGDQVSVLCFCQNNVAY